MSSPAGPCPTNCCADRVRIIGSVIAVVCCWFCCGARAVGFDYTNPTKDPTALDDPDKVAAAVPLVTISAPKGISVNIASDQPSTTSLAGGPKITYEKIVLAADAMDFSQSV